MAFEAMGTGGRGRSHTPLRVFSMGDRLPCAALGMKSRRSQGPLQLRVSHLSSGHGGSSCLQAHEQLCVCESPLSTCNTGLVRGEQPQWERQTATQIDAEIAASTTPRGGLRASHQTLSWHCEDKLLECSCSSAAASKEQAVSHTCLASRQPISGS